VKKAVGAGTLDGRKIHDKPTNTTSVVNSAVGQNNQGVGDLP
jgi:hypothetical protein